MKISIGTEYAYSGLLSDGLDSSSSTDVSTASSHFKNGNGSKLLKLQTAISMPRFRKSTSVTPIALVRSAPNSEPTIPPPLKIDINKAKREPSTPGGQSRAARTRTGMKATCPKTVSTTSSPKVNSSSGIPIWRLTWYTKSSCVVRLGQGQGQGQFDRIRTWHVKPNALLKVPYKSEDDCKWYCCYTPQLVCKQSE